MVSPAGVEVSSRFPGRVRVLLEATAKRFVSQQRRAFPAEPRKILVVPTILIGDTLLVTPLLAKLRERYPQLRHFDALVLSYKVGAMKPHPEIYRAAIEQAGCAPEECFYSDDIAEYVEAGRRMGMDAVQFQSVAQLQQELKTRRM